jgi:hypothetical protein
LADLLFPLLPFWQRGSDHLKQLLDVMRITQIEGGEIAGSSASSLATPGLRGPSLGFVIEPYSKVAE